MTDIGAAGRQPPTPAATAPATTSAASSPSLPAAGPSAGADGNAGNAVNLADSLARLVAGGPFDGLVAGRAGDGRALLRLAGQTFLFDDGQRLAQQARISAELTNDGGQLSARLTLVDGRAPDPALGGRLSPAALPAGTAARALAALADQLAQGSVRNATVLGPGQGGSVVLIDGAPYRLAGAEGLKPGSTLTLRLTDGGQAQIVARDGTPVYPPLRAGLETIGGEALTRLVGKEVAGIVVPGGGQGLPLAPGSQLMLKMLAPGGAAQGPSILSGYVAGTDAQGRSLVQTAAGTLALTLGQPLPLGTQLSLDLVRLTPPGSPQAMLGRGDPAARATEGWNAQVAGLAALRESAPELAAQITARLPQPGTGLAAALLGAVAALSSGEARSLLGRDGIAALERGGKKDAARRARAGADDLGELAQAPSGPEGWQTLLLPLMDGPHLRQIAIYVRGRKPKAEDSEGMPSGTRFVVDAPLEKIGTLQFDGFIRGNSIDVILRSGQALPSEWRRDIQTIFSDALITTGYQGSLAFQAGAKLASPLDEMRRTAHDDGQVVI
jgi:hypothetical protein